MPTYAITSAAGRIEGSARTAIVAAITAIHHEETGAPKYLVQIVFYDLGPSSHFIGGEPASAHQIWVRGDIRAGRTDAQKGRILQRILDDVSRLTGAPSEEVYVYLADIPAQSVIEYGRVLTAPGDEEAWLVTLPLPLQERLRRMG